MLMSTVFIFVMIMSLVRFAVLPSTHAVCWSFAILSIVSSPSIIGCFFPISSETSSFLVI